MVNNSVLRKTMENVTQTGNIKFITTKKNEKNAWLQNKTHEITPNLRRYFCGLFFAGGGRCGKATVPCLKLVRIKKLEI